MLIQALRFAAFALLLPALFLAPLAPPTQDAPRDPFAEPPALARAGPLDPGSEGRALFLRGLAERADGHALALVETARGEVLLLGVGDSLTVGARMLEVQSIGAGGLRLVPPAGGSEVHLR